jgi:hypothetical protein
MAVSLNPASVDPGSTASLLDWAAATGRGAGHGGLTGTCAIQRRGA